MRHTMNVITYRFSICILLHKMQIAIASKRYMWVCVCMNASPKNCCFCSKVLILFIHTTTNLRRKEIELKHRSKHFNSILPLRYFSSACRFFPINSSRCTMTSDIFFGSLSLNAFFSAANSFSNANEFYALLYCKFETQKQIKNVIISIL